MVVSICDRRGECVAELRIADGAVQLRGELPGGLAPEDLERLGFVYYETNERGKFVPRVQEVEAGETLDYLRALIDSLPPGYHLAQVQSEKIEHERRLRRARFEAELDALAGDGAGGSA